MDYSIHDAIEAGFNHVVFIIRKDIEKEFKEVIGDRIASICSSHNVTVDYAFHNLSQIVLIIHLADATGHTAIIRQRVLQHKACHAGLSTIHQILMYGFETFLAVVIVCIDDDKRSLDNGGVTRGICKMDDQNNLTEVVETKNIVKTATGAEVDGVAVDVNSLVSMNMWGLTPEFLDVLEEGFKEFFEKEVPGNPLKAEYLIPIFIGELLEQGKMSVKVLKTSLDRIMDRVIHDDMSSIIHWLQLFDSCSKGGRVFCW